MAVTFRTQPAQTSQLTPPRSSRVEQQIAAVCMCDRSPIVAKNCDTKSIGTRIWPKFAVMEAIVKRIGAGFVITTCLSSFPVQRGAQNDDTLDLNLSQKRWHGLRC